MANDYRYTIRIPPETARLLAEIAEQHGRSFNREVQAAVETWTRQVRDPSFRAALQAASEPTVDRIAMQAQEILKQVTQPETQRLFASLSDPAVQEYLRGIAEAAEAWSKLSAPAFQRDWDSDADRAYDDLP